MYSLSAIRGLVLTAFVGMHGGQLVTVLSKHLQGCYPSVDQSRPRSSEHLEIGYYGQAYPAEDAGSSEEQC